MPTMTTATFDAMPTLPALTVSARELAELCAQSRGALRTAAGSDHLFGACAELSRLEPVVRERDVVLDLCGVQRIDAAGIAALVSLYRGAEDAGRQFTLANVPARVAGILTVVGLDVVLLAGQRTVRTAA